MVQYLQYFMWLCVSHLDFFQGTRHSFASKLKPCQGPATQSLPEAGVVVCSHGWITHRKLLGNRKITIDINVFVSHFRVWLLQGTCCCVQNVGGWSLLLMVCFIDPEVQTNHQSLMDQISNHGVWPKIAHSKIKQFSLKPQMSSAHCHKPF